jgi:hypothetical protein
MPGVHWKGICTASPQARGRHRAAQHPPPPLEGKRPAVYMVNGSARPGGTSWKVRPPGLVASGSPLRARLSAVGGGRLRRVVVRKHFTFPAREVLAQQRDRTLDLAGFQRRHDGAVLALGLLIILDVIL